MTTQDGFIANYYDWADFERFVKDLYEAEGDVTVEHDVTEVDRYGAKRQTDVKITRRTKLHTYITLVECKRWNKPVTRDRIDVLASSIEALGAQKGALFTTTGFEEGAKRYAAGKNIDIFVVRDLTPSEWGAPGRHVKLFLHYWSGEFTTLAPGQVQAIALINPTPAQVQLGIHVTSDNAADPDYDLRCRRTGRRGPSLISLTSDAHRIILDRLSHSVSKNLISDSENDACMRITIPFRISISGTYTQPRLPQAAFSISNLEGIFTASVSQSKIEVDRGKNLDFALTLENYITSQKTIISRKKNDRDVSFTTINPAPSSPTPKPVTNGSIIKVTTSAWVSLSRHESPINAVANSRIAVTFNIDDSGHPSYTTALETISR